MSDKPFLSRVGLLKNLSRHLLQGKWAAMIGGPMIGKTILAAQLTDLIRDAHTRAVLVLPGEIKQRFEWWPLLSRAIFSQGFSSGQNNPVLKSSNSLSELLSQLQHLDEERMAQRKLILLIDDCDRILDWSEELISELVALSRVMPSLHAICWIGGPVWGDWVLENREVFKVPVRCYPLSVVPIREARAILLEHVGPEEADRVWHETGSHPFLIEKYFRNEKRRQPHELCKRLWQELRPEEKTLLSQLDPDGGWMSLEDVSGADGHRPDKALIDRLCMLGLAVRTLDQGRAVIRITSPLLTPQGET